ncbi:MULTISPECIES: tyrosine-type recombinase/integrase [unclassified Bradyrhizobium]|uniref:tyrosine-type recombinase/integrase n=1 Tax=unclassified Bradyrhizobium TaxID=2631580 RepID=UPI002479ADE3|nr:MULTISPECIES: tyrosine-type recombinase/integrase [unclassified Bradyrhizobium]WGS18968.1 tyrosine-type recombinase/integrase [Bradyrhizobium sp. ISRA463]WGS25802.1 tyrosine-type recombinase/integrase [Bradyrhizobium sp. ISRA464]
MRMNLVGLYWTQAKLANGTLVKYYYAWKKGPRIKAKYGTQDFIREYNEHIASRKKPKQGLVFALIAEFKISSEFKQLSDKTKKDYLRYIKLIEEEFGDMPLEAIEEPGARGEFKSWRDSMANNPRKADYAWTVMARIFSVAKDRGRITINPCERGGRLYESGDRLEKVWGENAIQQMIEAAAPPLVDAMMLALWTGQREGDLLKLKWSDYDGRYIRLIQSKSIRHGKRSKAKRVTIPVSGPLKTYLDASKKRGIFILMNTRDRPWTKDGFRSSWGKAFASARINEDLTFHDLRGSAVIRLALAGSTVPEIATFTGHSLKDVETILDKHYLGRDVRLAESAARKLEAMFHGRVSASSGLASNEGT